MVRGAIDSNNLPPEVRTPMCEGHTHKKLPLVHIIYLKDVILDPKEDAPGVTIGREPIPRELVATKSLKLMEQERFLNRLLETNNVYVFTAHVFLNLALAARRAKTPNVPNEKEKGSTHWNTDYGVVPLLGTERTLLLVEG